MGIKGAEILPSWQGRVRQSALRRKLDPDVGSLRCHVLPHSRSSLLAARPRWTQCPASTKQGTGISGAAALLLSHALSAKDKRPVFTQKWSRSTCTLGHYLCCSDWLGSRIKDSYIDVHFEWAVPYFV